MVRSYFDGIYNGNVDLLRSSFKENAYIYGDVGGKPYAKSLEEYLGGVISRKSPRELGEPNQMEILGIEILGQVALAKVHLPMLGFNYYDYLSLCVIEGEWKIVNKVFSHVA